MLVSAPPSVPPMPAEHMLSFVPWLQGVEISVIRFMRVRFSSLSKCSSSSCWPYIEIINLIAFNLSFQSFIM